jgi:hypothetical protein
MFTVNGTVFDPDLFARVRGRLQAVEKVVVGPIGSLKQLQNTSKPVQNTTKPGFQALENGDQRTTQGSFSTRWLLLGSLYAGSRIGAGLCGGRMAHHRMVKHRTQHYM